ncbi:MAG: hypothetical protein ACKOQ2_31945, partial [Dolichospermum sp.]
ANKTQSLVIGDNVATEDLTEVKETLISEDVSSNLYANETALATATKSELVANTAGSLGIELSTTEIDHIANNFDNSSDDFTETLEQVKSAIIAY